MAIGQQESRTVTGGEFTITTVTGIVDAIGGFDAAGITGAAIPDGTSVPMTAIEGNADLVILVDVASNVVTLSEEWLQDGGTGYDLADVITVSGADLGGDGGGTATFTVDSLVGEAATVTVTDGGTGWLTGDAIGSDETTSDGSGVGFAGTVAATAGVITAITVTDGGTGYVSGDAETLTYSGTGEVGVPSADYINHDEYEMGGVVEEYTKPRNATAPQEDWQGTMTGGYNPADTPSLVPDDNDPTITTVLKADLPQLKVQKKMIDGGTITVYAEPTLVDANGNVVGNTVRAEDVTDEARCTALGFTWNTDGNGGVDGSSYGYCSEVVAFDATLDKTVCVANGYLFDTVADVCVDADGADEAVVEAYLNGGAGDLYEDDTKKVICKAQGHFWNGTACVAAGSVDFGATYTTQVTCSAAGGLWLAGTCYNPEAFGNGQGGDFSETVGSHND